MRAPRQRGIDTLTLWWFGVAAALLAVLLFTSCSAISPEQQAGAIRAIDSMLRAGIITIQEHADMIAALNGGGWVWPVLSIVLPILGAWFGVPTINNLTRGRVTDRKGLAEALANISPQQMQGGRVTAAADKAAEATPVAPIKTPANIPVTPG